MDAQNMAKTAEIYARAQQSAARDPLLLHRLQNTWHALHALPADAPLDAQVDAAHALLVAMVLSFRADPAIAA